MPSQKNRIIQILDSLTKSLEVLRQPAEICERNARVAQAMRDLADLLVLPSSNLPAEPNYHTVQDYRGDPFASGSPIQLSVRPILGGLHHHYVRV